MAHEPGGIVAGGACRSSARTGVYRGRSCGLQALNTVDEYLPVALLHLREVEIVRLCGLTRAARGQEYIRANQVRHPERAAGTLQGAVLDSEQAWVAMAHFSDAGLDSWACSCLPAPADASPSLDQTSPATGERPPCEPIAALPYLRVRTPGA